MELLIAHYFKIRSQMPKETTEFKEGMNIPLDSMNVGCEGVQLNTKPLMNLSDSCKLSNLNPYSSKCSLQCGNQ